MQQDIKKCSSCKEEKLIKDYNKNNAMKDKLNIYCVSCLKIIAKKHYEYNKIKYKEKYIKLREEKLIYQTEYNKYNRARRRASDGKRRAIKLKSKPNWLTTKDLQYIKNIYELCLTLKDITGEEHNVDHIIPLQNSLVCGLHVPWNLQILTAKENLQKSNTFDIYYNTEIK